MLAAWLFINHAALAEAYSEARFAALQAENALILVDVYAPWCPTCARQQEILEAYRRERPESRLHWLKVDFDNDKAAVKAFRAPRQSTLLLYRGTGQIWFSVAETRRETIFETLDKAAETAP